MQCHKIGVTAKFMIIFPELDRCRTKGWSETISFLAKVFHQITISMSSFLLIFQWKHDAGCKWNVIIYSSYIDFEHGIVWYLITEDDAGSSFKLSPSRFQQFLLECLDWCNDDAIHIFRLECQKGNWSSLPFARPVKWAIWSSSPSRGLSSRI